MKIKEKDGHTLYWLCVLHTINSFSKRATERKFPSSHHRSRRNYHHSHHYQQAHYYHYHLQYIFFHYMLSMYIYCLIRIYHSECQHSFSKLIMIIRPF